MTIAKVQPPATAVRDGALTPRRRRTTRRSASGVGLGALGVVLAVAVWQALLTLGILPLEDIPAPLAVFAALIGLLGTSAFWVSLGQSVASAALGLVLATVVALPLGMLMGSLEPARRALRPTMEALRPIPGLALVPVVVVIWGPLNTSDVVLVAFACAMPLLTQTVHGVQNIDEMAVTTARSFGLNRSERLRFVVLPGSLPYISTGMRLAAGLAISIAVGAEIIIGSPGLGTDIRIAQSALELETMYALILAAGLLGIAVFVICVQAERRVLRWHPSQREVAA